MGYLKDLYMQYFNMISYLENLILIEHSLIYDLIYYFFSFFFFLIQKKNTINYIENLQVHSLHCQVHSKTAPHESDMIKKKLVRHFYCFLFIFYVNLTFNDRFFNITSCFLSCYNIIMIISN